MAHDTEKLRELLARVESCVGPDRRLAGDLLHFFCKDGEGMTRMFGTHDVPDLTASVDATLVVFERNLPGWEIDLSIIGNHAGVDVRGPAFGDSNLQEWKSSKVIRTPLAILSALLRALISQAEGESA